MKNRLKQLPLNVQKRLYEIAGMAGTNCPGWGSAEHNQATPWVRSSSQPQKNYTTFFDDHARHNLEHRISWS